MISHRVLGFPPKAAFVEHCPAAVYPDAAALARSYGDFVRKWRRHDIACPAGATFLSGPSLALGPSMNEHKRILFDCLSHMPESLEIPPENALLPRTRNSGGMKGKKREIGIDLEVCCGQ